MNSKERQVMQQALEALEQSETFVPYEGFGMARREAERKHQAAITALRAALAEPVQEPVAWRWTESNGKHWFDWRTDWTHHDRAKELGFHVEYAYTAPPQRKPLTDKQKLDLATNWFAEGWTIEKALDLLDDYDYEIEQAHGIKDQP